MGKGFLNKFKKKNSKFLHVIEKVGTKPVDSMNNVVGTDNPVIHSPFSNIPSPFVSQRKGDPPLMGNPIEQGKFLIKQRGTQRGKRSGKRLEKVGGLISLAGTLSGQPEISAVGVGISAAGEFEEGKSAGEIVGNALGNAVGGQLGGGTLTGQLVGGNIAGEIGGKIGAAIDKDLGDSSVDRTHHRQLADQRAENQHIDDKEVHHNQVHLPGDLQGTASNNTGIVGNTLMNGVGDLVSSHKDELLQGVSGGEAIGETLGFLMNNFDKLENLGKADKDDVFDTLLDSGLLDDFLRLAVSSAT